MSFDNLRKKAAGIKWLFTDVDGTLTDGSVYVNPQGEAMKRFSMRDGTGFFLLREAGIKVGIVTGEDSPIVARRAEKLKVDALLMNAVPKVRTVEIFCFEKGLQMEEIAYIGDDLNDLSLMQVCGLSFAVGDADLRVSNHVDYICTHLGGNGAFREAAEILLQLKGIDISAITKLKL